MTTQTPTPHQARMLTSALDRGGRLSAGRYGWNTAHVRAMQTRGWVQLVARYTWDSEWRLTDEGRRVALECQKGAS